MSGVLIMNRLDMKSLENAQDYFQVTILMIFRLDQLKGYNKYLFGVKASYYSEIEN